MTLEKICLYLQRNYLSISFRLPSSIPHRLQYHLSTLILALFRWLPRRLRASVGIFLGQVIYYLGIRRSVTEKNLAAAFPSLPAKGVRNTARRTFRHFGSVAASLSVIPQLKPTDEGKWIYANEFSVLKEALQEGRGCLVFSGHLGNWELMGAMASVCSIPATFVVTTQRNKRVEGMVNNIRRSAGIEIVKRREAARGVLSALKRNRCVALLIDQDAHEDGAFVPFFGRLASTPRGPAVFHLRTGAPLVFASCVRLPGERYRIDFDRLNTRGITDPDKLTALMTARLEQAIRETPDQWFWMHRRWKTRPPAS